MIVAAAGAMASVWAIAGSAGETNQLSAAETSPQNPSVTTIFFCVGVMGPAFEPVRVDMASRSLYPRGSEISALTPSQTSVETADGTWTFVGYDRTTVEASMDNADDEGNVHFSGAWKFTRKATPAQPGDGGATAGANPAGKARSSPRPPTRLAPVRFSR